MAVNIGINGFGRIGRLALCQLLRDKTFEIVALNDTVRPELLAWLLKYETSRESDQRGRPFFADTVESGPDFISIRGKKIKTFAETDPAKLPWKKLKVDLVLDCANPPASKEKAAAHLAAGAKKVLLAPPSVDYANLPVIIHGINEKNMLPADRIISAASPALNSLAPLVKALNDFAPIRSAIFSAENGAGGMDGKAIAAALGRVFPELQGKLAVSAAAGNAGSAVLITAVVKGKGITVESLNKALNTKADPNRTLVLSIDEDLYQVQAAALYDSEAASVARLVKTLKYFAEPRAASPAKPVLKAPPAKPVTGKPARNTGLPKGGTAKPDPKKPAGGAKPVNPALPRKPLINFPK